MPINTSTLITRIVEQTLTKPSSAFGRLVPILDFAAMGRLAKEFRLKKNVPAKNIAKELKLSKTAINFLETGNKKWTRKLLEAYLAAVEKHQSDVPLNLQAKERREKGRRIKKQRTEKMMRGRAERAAI